MSLTEAEVQAFVKAYAAASGTKDFAKVAKFIHPAAIFRFTDGDFVGIENIQTAFEWTWNSAEDDRYTLSDVKVTHLDAQSASATYDFNWSGVTDGRAWSARGRGSAVIVRHEGQLQIVLEHLSR
jgi:ketosteroid isomerase-like protein